MGEELQLAWVYSNARRSFWRYCQLMAPKFYKEDRPHLKKLCETLQSLYEGTLLNDNGDAYKKLIIQMPPRHGKSRTLILFVSWVFGKQNDFKVILGSYNDNTAQDFSKYTRNTLQEKKNLEDQIVFSDIFCSSDIVKLRYISREPFFYTAASKDITKIRNRFTY